MPLTEPASNSARKERWIRFRIIKGTNHSKAIGCSPPRLSLLILVVSGQQWGKFQIIPATADLNIYKPRKWLDVARREKLRR